MSDRLWKQKSAKQKLNRDTQDDTHGHSTKREYWGGSEINIEKKMEE
jgi:hypothetical protein